MSSFLRSHLQQVLVSHLNVVYVKGSRRSGQLLLRKGGGLQHALYCALSDLRSTRKDTEMPMTTKVHTAHQESSTELPEEDVVIKSLNGLIHDQAQEWIKRFQSTSAYADNRRMRSAVYHPDCGE